MLTGPPPKFHGTRDILAVGTRTSELMTDKMNSGLVGKSLNKLYWNAMS